MLEYMSHHLQVAYIDHKYAFATLVLLATIITGATADILAKIPAVWSGSNSLTTANRRKGSPRW